MAKWYNTSESVDIGLDKGAQWTRTGDTFPVTNTIYIQGAWITVPSASDMYDMPFEKLFSGQKIHISETNEVFEVTRFMAGVNGWSDRDHDGDGNFPYNPDGSPNDVDDIIFANTNTSHSFAPYTWSSSSFALTASYVHADNIDGSVGGSGFPHSGGDTIITSQAVITGSLLLSGSGHITASGNISASNITASNLHIDNNINLDGTLSFDGFSFSDGNILQTSGSTVFGDSASQDTHTFTGSLYISGGIYLNDSLSSSSDVKLHGTSSYAITSSHVISSSYAITSSHVISSSYAISASSVISSSYAISASNVISSSYAISASNVISSSYAISASNVVTSSHAITASNAITSSNSISSSYAITSSNSISSSFAISASYVKSLGQIVAAEGQFGTFTTYINDHITSSGNVSASGEFHILEGNLHQKKSISIGSSSKENFRSSSLLPINNQTDNTYITASLKVLGESGASIIGDFQAFDGSTSTVIQYYYYNDPEDLTIAGNSASLDFDIGGFLSPTNPKYVINTASFNHPVAHSNRQIQISGSNVGGDTWTGIAEEVYDNDNLAVREFKFHNTTGYRWYRLNFPIENFNNARRYQLKEVEYFGYLESENQNVTVIEDSRIITNNLIGTSSQAISSSYATSASYAITASHVITSSHAVTASNAITSSFSTTSSFAITASNTITASNAITSSFAITSSNAISSSFAITSSNAISSSYAITASNVESSSYALTASNVTKFQTQSDSTKIDLSNLKIVNYSTDIFTTVVNGELTLTFGTPAEALISTNAFLQGFNSTRFNLVTDTYKIKWNINLNGNEFVSGTLTNTIDGTISESVNTAESVNFVGGLKEYEVENDLGNAQWIVSVNYKKADGSFKSISTTTANNTISNPTPGNPTISHDFSNATPDGLAMLVNDRLEKYVGGNYSWSTVEASNKNGFISNQTVGQFSNSSGTEPIPNTTSISETVTEFFESPSGKHTPDPLTAFTSDSFTINRMISLRTGSSALDTIAATDGNASGIISLTNWKANVGSIAYGIRLSTQIDDVTMHFNPDPTIGEYLYIVYDKTQGDLTAINGKFGNSELLGPSEVGSGWRKQEDIGDYRIYRTDGLNFDPSEYTVTFS